MSLRRLSLTISSILLIVVLFACAPSPTSAPSGSTSSPATLTENTVVATQPVSTTTVAENTAVPPTQPVNTAASGGCTNAYFPVTSGNNWSYSSSGNVLGAYTYTWTVTDVSDTGFTTSNQYSSGVNATIKWNCQNGNLAELDAGSNSLSMSTSKVKMTTDSVTGEGYNIPADFSTGATWSESVTANETVISGTKTINSQIVILTNCSAAGADSITTTAGTFNTVKATCNQTVTVSALLQGTPMPATPVMVSVTDWYAKGVGLVKSVRTSAASGTETIVLTQYKIQ